MNKKLLFLVLMLSMVLLTSCGKSGGDEKGQGATAAPGASNPGSVQSESANNEEGATATEQQPATAQTPNATEQPEAEQNPVIGALQPEAPTVPAEASQQEVVPATPAIDGKFALIPAGEFGEVSIEAFYIQEHETTQRQWKSVMPFPEETADLFRVYPIMLGDDKPMIFVSWEAVQVFIKARNNKKDGYTYRLPTEEEWEYAARGGEQTAYAFGDDEKDLATYAWYGEDWETGSPHPVAKKRPTKTFNNQDLYDIHGNVWEWVQDISGSHRVIRGGSWSSVAQSLRSAFRYNWGDPGDRDSSVGFRLVRTKI